ncbi:nucleotidyltransferase family protein [Pseudochryseolinea flava]|uniref:Nucleotidyltransferase family protein n=1 Tax=Pseudochryseolinea flava TaxID=2059302 RepID=A0A364Y0C0_9BACT|nr:nucleotidyltransferase family protein [Pseudochryseolinea flava]RAV99352.1 nucleotidyltransferase family protein [Pseudochryseolinea flava]
MSIGIIILAAGTSSRMGQSKQLLKIGNVSLLKHATQQALGASSHVTVVLGANANEHEVELRATPIQIAVNTQWQKGIGSSIKTGIKSILSVSPHIDGVLIMLCDQPKVTTAYLNTMIKTFGDSHGAIVVSRYEGTLGVPAIFSNEHFHDLLGLEDASGAKSVIMRYPNDVSAIDSPEAATDLDTPEDYSQFIATLK